MVCIISVDCFEIQLNRNGICLADVSLNECIYLQWTVENYIAKRTEESALPGSMGLGPLKNHIDLKVTSL